MIYNMNLWDDSFQAIKGKWKTIEMRLNDEKRSAINVGDAIEFTNTKTNEKMHCIVEKIYKYRDFEELYSSHDKLSIGYKEGEIADPKDMLQYYSKADIEKYGVLGIELTVTDDESLQLPEMLERTTLYESDYVCLYADKVKLPSGYIIDKYHQIHYPHESVVIAIFNEKAEILMIREKRYTVHRLEWEVPAGRIEDGETKEEAARREAMEETGCTLKDLKFLCMQNPANGMSDCTLHVFAAKVDSENSIQDVDEVAYKKWMPISEVKELLKNNETKDGVSILAILFALQFYEC